MRDETSTPTRVEKVGRTLIQFTKIHWFPQISALSNRLANTVTVEAITEDQEARPPLTLPSLPSNWSPGPKGHVCFSSLNIRAGM